ncbi:unnamed protein product [Brassica oleracea]
MEVKEKVRIVITVASLVAATVLLVADYRRRRHGRKQTSSPSSCYLHSETKPQFGFKRVLADNSYSGFKHMKKLDDVSSSSLEKPNNSHPYESEITVLLENPCLDEVEFLRGECSLEISDSYAWVETESELKKLAEPLAKEKVFGVDTEQHSLRSFLGFTALIQREDWRQRPLSEEMVQYARTDAHYLLYIADKLTASEALITLPSPWMQRYILHSHFIMCIRYQSMGLMMFAFQFQELVRELCAWRDLMARIHDESTRYVLSDQAIIALACQKSTTAEEVYHSIAQADLAIESSSIQSPSSVVCSHLDDIYQMTRDNKFAKLDALLPLVLDKCLGTDGTCPVSVFNYSLLINLKTKLGVHSAPKQNGHRKNLKQFTRKSSRDLFVKKFSCKAPVYHNCRIYANDGRLLCYCDRKKLEWYMNRGLAKLVEEEPPAIILLFEPKGRPEDEGNDFYIQTKKNICVGCGEGNHYLRYRIIPSCYSVHFPEHLKSHRSHDIVLLCVDCHEVAHAAAERYKKQVATEFGIPLFVRRVVDSKEAASSVECDESRGNVEEVGVSPLHLRTAAMALLRHGNRMPSSRREELLQTVKMYYGDGTYLKKIWRELYSLG